MALRIFGAGGGGSGGEGGFGSAAIGAAGGFLSGGPIGGVAGLLGGLLGSGDQRQTTTYNYSQLTPEQRALMSDSEGVLGKLLGNLAPGQQEALIASLTSEMQGVARTSVEDTFRAQRGQQRMDAARSGGMLSSVQGTLDSQSAGEEGKSMASALLGARMGAEEIGAGRYAQTVGGVNATMGTITGLDSTRRLMSTTGVQQGNTVNDMLGGVMGALSNPMSAFNMGGFGMDGFAGGGKYGDFINSILNTGSSGSPNPQVGGGFNWPGFEGK